MLRVLDVSCVVVVHSEVGDEAGHPTGVAFDLWQIADGKIGTHWTDVEPWQATTANGHTQIDGVAVIDDSADAEATRLAASGAVQEILLHGRADLIPSYLAEGYIQHNPRFADGVSGLTAALGALAEQGITVKYDEILHVVVQGDFGYLHSNGHFGGEAYTFHDLFRVSDGKGVEHWDVMVPAK